MLRNDWRLNEPEQRAVWKRDLDSSRIDVTIRSPDPTDPDTSNKVEILQEVAMMAQFRHPNIIKLHGAVNDGRVSLCFKATFHIVPLLQQPLFTECVCVCCVHVCPIVVSSTPYS